MSTESRDVWELCQCKISLAVPYFCLSESYLAYSLCENTLNFNCGELYDPNIESTRNGLGGWVGGKEGILRLISTTLPIGSLCFCIWYYYAKPHMDIELS